MELSREIYWNVGHGAMTLVPMYVLFLIACALMVKGFLTRLKIYRQGLPTNRTEDLGNRVSSMLWAIIGQGRVLRESSAGAAHGLFFWSFLLLVIGTTLIVVQADFTDLLFGIKFLKGPFYLGFSLILDLAGLLAVLMLVGLAVRRFVVKPAGLPTSGDDMVMHSLLLTILITGFGIEACRMAVTELGTPLANWSPIGKMGALLLTTFSQPVLLSLHRVLWWFHLALVMFFIATIPWTKFKHIVLTSANQLFVDRGPTGKLATMDLEDESSEQFGASQINHFTWKDIFDTDACTLCKRCQDRCPAYQTGKPLSPMQVINQLGDTAITKPDAGLIDVISRDVLWSCTTCRACQDICPAAIEHVSKIIEMRRYLVLMEGEFPGEEVMAAMENTEVNGNPLGMGYASRGDWAEGLHVPLATETDDFDILFFVGCYGSFDKRNIRVAKSFIKLCQAAQVKVAILGNQEKCCGEPMRKMGNEYLYQSLAMENVELLKQFAGKPIVTGCPHCFNTLAKDYRDFGMNAEVSHYTVYLNRLVESGKLRLQKGNYSCTYHDSCYLGRHNDIYAAPRQLLEAAGCRLQEMEKNGSNAFCCSAGGGRIMAEEKLGERINIKRVKMARATGASTLVANCPFCLTMFEDGVKGAELDGQLVPKDIVEILAEQLAA